MRCTKQDGLEELGKSNVLPVLCCAVFVLSPPSLPLSCA